MQDAYIINDTTGLHEYLLLISIQSKITISSRTKQTVK